MKSLFDRKIILIVAFTSLCMTIFFVLMIEFGYVKNSIANPPNVVSDWSSVIKFVGAPVLTAAILLMIVDRFREITKKISDLEKEQSKSIREIKELLEDRVELYLTDKTRKVEAINSKVSNLIEEHPWVAGITENDIIPQVMSCRVVLITANKFFEENKIGLLYEYLFSCARKNNDKSLMLEGSVDDFMDLIEFCDNKIYDRYLGFLFMKLCFNEINESIIIYPNYLLRLISFNKVNDAYHVYSKLKSIVMIKWWRRIFFRSKVNVMSNRKTFMLKGFSSLAVFEAFIGKEKESDRMIKKAYSLAGDRKNDLIDVKINDAERLVILRDFDDALSILSKIEVDEDCSDNQKKSINRINLMITGHEVVVKDDDFSIGGGDYYFNSGFNRDIDFLDSKESEVEVEVDLESKEEEKNSFVKKNKTYKSR